LIARAPEPTLAGDHLQEKTIEAFGAAEVRIAGDRSLPTAWFCARDVACSGLPVRRPRWDALRFGCHGRRQPPVAAGGKFAEHAGRVAEVVLGRRMRDTRLTRDGAQRQAAYTVAAQNSLGRLQ
jgi:hypothetical protein